MERFTLGKRTLYYIKIFLIVIICFLQIFLTGCGGYSHKPRLRLGAYFGAPLGIAYPEPNNLGKHDYNNCWGERIGMAYTCKGGFIDIGHLRDSADRTLYCALITYENLLKGNTEFSFSLLEPSEYLVTIKYPENWSKLPDKEKVAHELSIGIGQYFAYTAMVWHEIIGWYGYKYTGIFSEYVSAFSWEDIYSDVIGVEIAEKAMNEDRDHFDKVMTKLIYDELKGLGVQPVSIAKKAEKKVRGKWYSGLIYPFVKLNKRNLETGFEDGYVTPWLVLGICENAEPLPYAVPNLNFLKKYNLMVDLKIKPTFWEKNKVLKVAYPDGNGKYIVPSRDFPVIMKDVEIKEIERNGPEVNVPNL